VKKIESLVNENDELRTAIYEMELRKNMEFKTSPINNKI
jgi:hypothetical protein